MRLVRSFVRPRYRWRWRIEPEDAYLVSYPRSGNTWLRQALALLRHPGIDLQEDDVDRYVPDPYHNATDLEWAPRPRLIKSHAPHWAGFPRVIYVVRDGRDAIASYYKLETASGRFAAGFPAFLEREISGAGPYGPWHDHVLSWLRARPQNGLLLLRYEDLRDDLPAGLKAVCAFLSWRCPPEAIEAAARGATRQVREEFLRRRYPEAWARGVGRGLTGMPGGWREVFDARSALRFWSVSGEAMEAAGYHDVASGSA